MSLTAVEQTDAHNETADPVAWRVKPWLDQVPIGLTKFYSEVNAGRIKLKKCGNASLVETSPKEYVAALPSKHAA